MADLKILNYKGTGFLPSIILDAETGTFEISGASIPEDAAIFFKPIMDWIIEYLKKPNPTTIFHIKLEYFNSNTSKFIHELSKKLEKVHAQGDSQILINWYYEPDDEVIRDVGKEFQTMFKIPFEVIKTEL